MSDLKRLAAEVRAYWAALPPDMKIIPSLSAPGEALLAAVEAHECAVKCRCEVWQRPSCAAADCVGHITAQLEAAKADIGALRAALGEALDAIDAVEAEPGAGVIFPLDWVKALRLLRATR